MVAPLKGSLVVTSPFGTAGSQWAFNKHMGVDLRASVGTPLYAPEDGTINERYPGTNGVLVLGLAGSKWHRFLHLSKFSVALGAKVKAGQLIGYTGDTGNVAAHLHWDVRKPNTVWSALFSNYYDPMILLKEEDMVTNREEAIRLERIITMNHTPTEAQIKASTGKDLASLLTDRYDDGDFVANKDIVKVKYPAAVKVIAALKAQLADCKANSSLNKTSVVKYVSEKLT